MKNHFHHETFLWQNNYFLVIGFSLCSFPVASYLQEGKHIGKAEAH